MARGRMLNTTVATDLRLNELSLEAHWAYMMAIPHLDRDGIMLGHPKIVTGRICPLRPEVGVKMAEIIGEWVSAGLVVSYDSGNGPLLYFSGFQKNQNLGASYIKEGKSVFPPPPGYIRTSTGLTPQEKEYGETNSGVTPELLPTNSGNSLREDQVEVKDQDQLKAFPSSQAPKTHDTPQQELFLAICEAVGWDYKTLSKKDKAQVGQCMGILTKAEYGIDDIRRFMVEIWFHDWRWEKHQQRPTLSQLRQEIGKLRAGTPETVPRKEKGIEGYRAMLARQGIEL